MCWFPNIFVLDIFISSAEVSKREKMPRNSCVMEGRYFRIGKGISLLKSHDLLQRDNFIKITFLV